MGKDLRRRLVLVGAFIATALGGVAVGQEISQTAVYYSEKMPPGGTLRISVVTPVSQANGENLPTLRIWTTNETGTSSVTLLADSRHIKPIIAALTKANDDYEKALADWKAKMGRK